MSWSAAFVGAVLFPEPMGARQLRCSCGLPALLVADLSTDGGIYIRTPICSPTCKLVRQALDTVDVVLEEREITVAQSAGTCWCRLPRRPGSYVTWCPRHGQIDAVDGVCN